MKSLWFLGLLAIAPAAMAQQTIYKHVDGAGRVTYSNKPMKDAVVVELEPLTTIPATPMGNLVPQPQSQPQAQVQAPPQKTASAAPISAAMTVSPSEKSNGIKPAVAIVMPVPSAAAATFASVDTGTQRKRDEERRKILGDELDREEKDLSGVRKTLLEEQQNPTLAAAVRLAQQTVDPTPAQQLELRKTIEKASSRIRGLQATVAEHEKNIEALKKELGALKP